MAVKEVAVTLPEALFDMVERAGKIEHRTRSEVIQEALRTRFGKPVYVPTDEERRHGCGQSTRVAALLAPLDGDDPGPFALTR